MNGIMKNICRIYRRVALALISAVSVPCIFGCTIRDFEEETKDEESEIVLNFITDISEKIVTRSASYTDMIPEDINLYIWRNGKCVRHLFMETAGTDSKISMARGSGYSFYAIAGAGMPVEPQESGWKMDEGSMQRMVINASKTMKGIPMAGKITGRNIDRAATTIDIVLERLMSRIVFNYVPDTALSGSGIKVTSVRLCDAACMSTPFCAGFRANEKSVLDGDFASEKDLQKINSGEAVTLYAFENCWGSLLPENSDPSRKVPEEFGSITGPTFIEVKCAFGENMLLNGSLTYRIYLGADAVSNFDLERNATYRVILYGSRDGLDEVSWRIDKDFGFNDSLANFKLTKSRHPVDNLYLGEIVEGRLADIDASVLDYFGGSLDLMIRSSKLRCMSDTSADEKNDLMSLELISGHDSSNLTVNGTCKNSGEGCLWLCRADGTPITRICSGIRVNNPLPVISFAMNGDAPEPIDEQPTATINGEDCKTYFYLCDNDGVNLLAKKWAGYGFSTEVFSPVLAESYHNGTSANVRKCFKTWISDVYKTDDGASGQAFCTMNLQVSNDGKSSSINNELWPVVRNLYAISIGINDAVHKFGNSCRCAVSYFPFELCCYDRSYGGRSIASELGVTAPFFVTVKNLSRMSFILRYMSVTQRGIAQTQTVPAIPSGISMLWYTPPTSISLPPSLYCTYAESKVNAANSSYSQSCSTKMLDDGTAVIGITKSLYNLIDAVKAAEGKYCHDKYGYHSDNLQQYTYTFHIKNGISILVDIAAQDGKQVSFKYADGLENDTEESSYIYSQDYEFKSLRYYSAGTFCGGSNSAGYPFSGYADLNPYRMSQFLDKSRTITLQMNNNDTTKPYLTLGSSGTLSNTKITVNYNCDGFCRTHARGTKRDPVDYSHSCGQSATIAGTSGTAIIGKTVIANLFNTIYETTYKDSYNWYGSANSWQHHSHPTKLTMDMTISTPSSSSEWYIYNFTKYSPTSLTYDNSGYSSDDSNPYTVVTSFDWKTTHARFSNLLVMLR